MNITYKNPSSYKTEKKSAIILNLLYIASLLIGALIISHIPQTHAQSLKMTCSNAYIGYEYNPKLDKPCKRYFDMWTREILISFNTK